jgi:RalA-binding protein 1
LIIEAGKGGSGQARHVLCAESDEERDSWVEVLVKYIHGDPKLLSRARLLTQAIQKEDASRPNPVRADTSSSVASDVSSSGRQIHLRKPSEEKSITKENAQPLSQLAQDRSNAKLFQGGVEPSVINAREMQSTPPPSYEVNMDRNATQQSGHWSSLPATGDESLSTSLPSDLEHQIRLGAASLNRGEGGSHPMEPTPLRNKRQSMMPPPRGPTHGPSQSQQTQRAARERGDTSPAIEQQLPATTEEEPVKVNGDKISAPRGGTAIPHGFKFGNKAALNDAQPERERKAKSGRFWGFGRSGWYHEAHGLVEALLISGSFSRTDGVNPHIKTCFRRQP